MSFDYLNVDAWGVTPAALLAPLGLMVLILMGGRLSRSGPSKQRDIGGVVLIVAIIGTCFVLVYAGLRLVGIV